MQRVVLILSAVLVLFGLSGTLSTVEAQPEDILQAPSSLEEIVQSLATARRNEIPALVENIAELEDLRRRAFLESMLEGQSMREVVTRAQWEEKRRVLRGLQCRRQAWHRSPMNEQPRNAPACRARTAKPTERGLA